MSDQVVHLTQHQFDALTAELGQIETVGMKEIARTIETAREEGDLRENGGYHAAKEQQGKMAARMRHIRHLLLNAQVAVPVADDGVVHPGAVVTVAFDEGEKQRFLLGNRQGAGGLGIEVLSVDSAMGAALLEHRVGDEVSYTTPRGRTLSVTVVEVTPFVPNAQ